MAIRSGALLGADGTSSSVAFLKSVGAQFISRYTSEQSWALTPSEARNLSNGGIWIVSNYEHYTNDIGGGFAQGVTNAHTGWRVHTACGGPADRPIYFSVDEDVDPNLADLHQYFAGAVSVLGVGRVGVYGSTAVCLALKAAGLVTYTWRTMSTGWRGGAGVPSDFNVEQTGYFNSSYDRDAAITEDFGQWMVGVSPNPGPTPTPTPTPGGNDMLTPADVLSVWAYQGGDATGPDDAPDVHQSLLTCRDALVALVGDDPAHPNGIVPQLVGMVAALKTELDAVKALVTPPPPPAPAPSPAPAPGA